MTLNHPLVDRYIAAFDAALKDLQPAERAEVVAEIRQHIADATAAGKPIDDVLQSLGSVEALARAYQLELLVNRTPATAQPRSDRWLKILGLLAIGSLPTFIIVVALGTMGIGFTLSGIVVVIAGIADSVGSLPGWMTSDVEPWIAIVVGVVITLVGVLCCFGTVSYVKFVVRLVRRILPKSSHTTA